MISSVVRTTVLSSLTAALLAAPLTGQLIPIRTVPLASGDQFLTLPSATLGMSGVTLAVDDSLADPWTNPAQGVFIREATLLGAPTFYGISGAGGAGRTFPLAGHFRSGPWFGGVALALQQVEDEDRQNVVWRTDIWWPEPARRLSDASSRNLYAQTFLGRELGSGPWSIGLGLSAAGLDAMDGVDLLYANAERIEQSGTLADVRLGLYRRAERERLALLLVHDRVSMSHDVTYVDVRWDTVSWTPIVERRIEENLDRTRTWGAEVAWDRDLSAPGWRLGAALTANRKSHPKIPNYEIQNIPRDPGTTWAYEAGIGLSRSRAGTTFGLDVVLQPIWSDTWQEAAADTVTAGGTMVHPGDRTIENDFFFTNVVLRAGIEHRFGVAGVQAGIEVRSYDYDLEQRNHLEGSFRTQNEAWMEWSPSAGLWYRFDDVELRYAGRLTTGTGRPGVAFTDVAAGRLEAMADFIIAPEAPLTLQEATVLTHQVSVRIPIR
jgi:hypothetical protein